jgi:hypothetical protein
LATNAYPDAPEVALLLVVEAVVPERMAPPVNMQFQTRTFLYQPTGRELMLGTGKYGPAFRRLTLAWLDSRDGPDGTYAAMGIAQQANLGTEHVLRYAARALITNNPQPYYRASAIAMIGRLGGKAYVPLLVRHFGDETRVINANNQPDIQVRDAALAMALILTGQDPKAYGFDNQNKTNEAMRYSYLYHRFLDGERETADQKRTAAFAKWKAWEAALYGAAAGPAGPLAGLTPAEPEKAK